MEYETVLGLRKHKTYEEVLEYVNDDPDRITYPNRKDLNAYEGFVYGHILDALKDHTDEAGPPGARPPEFAERQRPDEEDFYSVDENPPDDPGEQALEDEGFEMVEPPQNPPVENPGDGLAREGVLQQIADGAADGFGNALGNAAGVRVAPMILDRVQG